VTKRMADIERAREDLRTGAWAEAYAQLSALDPSRLGPEDLEGLADGAWWLSRIPESLTVRQRAYSAWAAAGEDRRAAFAAWRLAAEHFQKGDGAVGSGWLRRAQRHLQAEPESGVNGYLKLMEADLAHYGGDLTGALILAERAAEIATRFEDHDLLALAIQTRGRLLIAQGRVADGSALLDEAMTSVIAGELSAYITGWIYCQVIYACLELADLRRAGEWNEAAMAWCESIPSGGLADAICRLNRAELVSLQGELARAEAEARRASEEFTVMGEQAMAAEALYAVGEYNRQMGDLAAAEEAFARAQELGRDPQPGLAQLRLAQGNVGAASAALRLSLDAELTNRLRRSRLLATKVEVALAAGDIDEARAACRELDSIAGEFETPALVATAALARGTVRLAEDDVHGALPHLRQGWAIWQDLKVPYEAAQARVLIGQARHSAGDEEGARRDLGAARAAFERLGAAGQARRTAELLGQARELPGGLTEREAAVLRLVATGRSNRKVAEELFISEHTVARHLQNIFAKLGVSSRAAATAFAVEHDVV
jgi:ATP/maltotriose-dependent transcriptional regulator MalT